MKGYLIRFISIINGRKVHEKVFDRVYYHHQWLEGFVKEYLRKFIGIINGKRVCERIFYRVY